MTLTDHGHSSPEPADKTRKVARPRSLMSRFLSGSRLMRGVDPVGDVLPKPVSSFDFEFDAEHIQILNRRVREPRRVFFRRDRYLGPVGRL